MPGRRNEENCEGSGKVLSIPVVRKPVVVPVPIASVVAVKVEHLAVAVRGEQKCAERRQYRYPLITQRSGISAFGIEMP